MPAAAVAATDLRRSAAAAVRPPPAAPLSPCRPQHLPRHTQAAGVEEGARGRGKETIGAAEPEASCTRQLVAGLERGRGACGTQAGRDGTHPVAPHMRGMHTVCCCARDGRSTGVHQAEPHPPGTSRTVDATPGISQRYVHFRFDLVVQVALYFQFSVFRMACVAVGETPCSVFALSPPLRLVTGLATATHAAELGPLSQQ